MTVDDAVKKSISINVNDTGEEGSADEFCETQTDSSCVEKSILHQAAEILIRRLGKTEKLEKEYFSPSEVNKNSQKSFLDPLLIQFISWLTDKQLFEEGNDITDVDQKVISICSDITALAAKVITPKQFGLTVYLHHQYGSKKLFEDLNEYGHTLPYSEIRHFLTSAAVHLAAEQVKTPSGALVPPNVQFNPECGQLVVAAADNWDHNERTFSGKKTTHAMTSLLVTPDCLIPTTRRLLFG